MHGRKESLDDKDGELIARAMTRARPSELEFSVFIKQRQFIAKRAISAPKVPSWACH